MSTITILNLYPAGAELLSDNESYLQEIADVELQSIKGGLVVSQVTQSAGYLGAPEYNVYYRYDRYDTNYDNNQNNQTYLAPESLF